MPENSPLQITNIRFTRPDQPLLLPFATKCHGRATSFQTAETLSIKWCTIIVKTVANNGFPCLMLRGGVRGAHANTRRFSVWALFSLLSGCFCFTFPRELNGTEMFVCRCACTLKHTHTHTHTSGQSGKIVKHIHIEAHNG